MTHPWRNHPKLKGRFHPQAPDDLQVMVHDGGPRISESSPELVWVTVNGIDINDDVFIGRVINQPKQLQAILHGAEIKFVAPLGNHLLMVTDKYLLERPNWNIHPCDQCGLDELFDAPSDLMRVVFSDLPNGVESEMFTSFCGMCRGIQVVEKLNASFLYTEPSATSKESEHKKWWQFWK